jgi:branched-chain amino acid aminotransferase
VSAAPVYVNGEFLPPDRAHVSVFDQGIQMGDGIYEMISGHDRKLFRLEDHLDRLEASMHATRILPKLTRDEWRAAVIETARRSGYDHVLVRIIVTRGIVQPGSWDPRNATPNVFMSPTPYASLGNEAQRRDGIRLNVAHQRGMTPDTLDPRYKHISRLQYQLAKIESVEAGYDDLIWLAPDGCVQEAPKSNVFMVKDGGVYTPGDGVLYGITRRTVSEVCADLGIEFQTARLTAFDFFNADEVFTTSTSGGALPVREVAGRPTRMPAPGPVTKAIDHAYWAMRRAGRHGTAF